MALRNCRTRLLNHASATWRSIVILALVMAMHGCADEDNATTPRASRSGPAPEDLIPFRVLTRHETGSIKVMFDVEVDLVDGRYPNEQELGAISMCLLAREKRHDRTFVGFFLPGMRLNAGAFATAHHNPQMEVRILGTMQVPDGPWDDEEDARIFTALTAGLQDHSNLAEVRTRLVGPQAVEVTIATVLPLPAEATIEVAIRDREAGAPWFGIEKSVRIRESPTTVLLDAADSSVPLPIAEYQATVVIQPATGEAGRAPNAKDRRTLVVDVGPMGSGATPAQLQRRKELRKWIADNVRIGTPWREAPFVEQLGAFEEIVADGETRPTLYFAEADAALILDDARSAIVSYRFGR